MPWNTFASGVRRIPAPSRKTLSEVSLNKVVSSAKAAEMVKVYENTFRAVNIALVNEMLLLCDRM